MSKKVSLFFFLLFYTIVGISQYKKIDAPLFHEDILENWSFEGNALYLKTDNRIFTGQVFSGNFAWGYGLKGIYQFTDTKKFRVTWTQYNNAESKKNTGFTTIFPEGLTRINGHQLEKLNVINLTLSQSLNFHNKIAIDIYGGLQYFRFINNKHIDFQSNISRSTMDSTELRKVYGIGPRVGLMFDYSLLDDFSLFVDAAYTGIAFRKGTKTINLTSIDRRSVPPKNSSYAVTLHQNGPMGGQDAALGLKLSIDRFQGKLDLKGGLTGISFDIEDTRFLGYFISATWMGNA